MTKNEIIARLEAKKNAVKNASKKYFKQAEECDTDYKNELLAWANAKLEEEIFLDNLLTEIKGLCVQCKEHKASKLYKGEKICACCYYKFQDAKHSKWF